MSTITLPTRKRGRQSAEAEARFAAEKQEFANGIIQIASTLPFPVSSRGWCYILEEHGLSKGDFNAAQTLINNCRKDGHLPISICAMDGAREFMNVENVDDDDVEAEAEAIVNEAQEAYRNYFPVSFWEDKEVYLQCVVEKVDLKSLFAPVLARFHIPIANAKGWADLNLRADMMRRFRAMEGEGKQCVILYCGDHDPAGLHISDHLRSNMADLSDAIGWSPSNLVINRFGLNHDFIEEQGLTWIDNLETGSGKSLDDPRHPDHYQPYVQDYLAEFGARKVEANALVTRIEAGRQLCLDTILEYLDEDAPGEYREELEPHQSAVMEKVLELMGETS